MMRKAAAMHLRAIKELHSVTPRFFPVLTLYCLFGAITPYVTVFFSARILTELAMLRRAEILWRWVLAGVLCVGLAAIGKALLYRRYNTLLEDLYGRKDMLFVHKTFQLDYSELDKQENHDLREQIKQNENWSGWGLMRVHEIYSGVVTGILGLFSGAVAIRAISDFHGKSPFVGGRISLRPGVFRCLYYSRLNLTCQAFFKTFLKIFRWTLFRSVPPSLAVCKQYNACKALCQHFFARFTFCTNNKPVLPFKLYRLHKSLSVLYRYNKKAIPCQKW